ncbi:hypothetical protein M405DRAFT_74421 [Rhizopogon salebrosus TDB-379]|nr:hypothetical protein M405DRAFT_74421 [Rhizopogon salebrosus TDB-379]
MRCTQCVQRSLQRSSNFVGTRTDDEALKALLEGPLAASAMTYSAPSLTALLATIMNIQVPAHAINQIRPLRPDMAFFSSSASNLQS